METAAHILYSAATALGINSQAPRSTLDADALTPRARLPGAGRDSPPRSSDLGEQLVASHVRSLQLESHLIDVPSSDHHTVRPWFAGKVDFAPLVKEIGADGYELKGGRVAGANDLSRASQIDGFSVRRWSESGLVVSCVSDLATDELQRFEQSWRAR
jgi:anti-sigma factor RsiW